MVQLHQGHGKLHSGSAHLFCGRGDRVATSSGRKAIGSCFSAKYPFVFSCNLRWSDAQVKLIHTDGLVTYKMSSRIVFWYLRALVDVNLPRLKFCQRANESLVRLWTWALGDLGCVWVCWSRCFFCLNFLPVYLMTSAFLRNGTFRNWFLIDDSSFGNCLRQMTLLRFTRHLVYVLEVATKVSTLREGLLA